MKYNNVSKLALGATLALQVPAAAENSGDWCSMLKSKPTIYKNSDNPYIQEIGFEGRLQWQTASIDVNGINGTSDEDTFTEWRRARLGTKVKFLNYFSAKYQANFVSDGRPSGGELEWDYQDIDEAYLTFDLNKAMGGSYFDDLAVGYGRYKYTLGYESTASSKKLLTVERSALANKVYGSSRPTGLKVDAAKGDWEFSAALYSTSEDGSENEFFSGFNDGEVLWFHAGYAPSGNWTYGFDASYNTADPTEGDDSNITTKWATSINAEYSSGNFGVIYDLIAGENLDSSNADREGTFYGAMVMPYYWVMEDKLQWVGQVQYMASDEDEGVRFNSRYGRRNHAANVNSGRGDNHLSLYTGLNYYICDHNAKVQGGIEWQDLDTPSGSVDTLTYILAVRTYF
ncbi:MAG: porin [Akkermansiaceae bacterium]|nr:porin [Akkermansiaceae bacterium]